MLTIAADPKHLGATIGITALPAHLGLGHDPSSPRAHDRHRGRDPHDGSRWIPSRPDYLVPVEILFALFRGRMLGMLLEAHTANRLQFFGDYEHLADTTAFRAYLGPLWKTDWFVYAKRAGPEQVLAYLSRYTHRVAISNGRLISAHASALAFKYKDYRIEGPDRYKTMTLEPGEFIRRFLMHVLPKGFRIRHYGLLANGGATRAEKLAHARQLIAAASR
jgi:Putative transposase